MYKEREVVIKELRELFSIDDNNHVGGSENDGVFSVPKDRMSRSGVVCVLQEYFNGVGVKDGYVSVDPITFIYTRFRVCNGVPS